MSTTDPVVVAAAPRIPVARSGPDRVRAVERDGVTVVLVRGDLDERLTPALRDALAQAVQRHADVVVDLSEAGVIDRHGLGVLLQSLDHAHAAAGRLCLAEPSAALVGALTELRAEELFPMFDSCSEAEAWLRDDPAR
jgi:anti-anti-sigma factor